VATAWIASRRWSSLKRPMIRSVTRPERSITTV
jgi:hypothetical protein